MTVIESAASLGLDTRAPLPVTKAVEEPASARPRLFVVVDTEEEFDWSKPFSRDNTSVTAMRHIGRAQEVFDRFSIRPTYVIDYPVASQRDGFAPLLEIQRDGRCQVGAHLHPWVNPPYDEQVTRETSFAMNLDRRLQEAKLQVLSDRIAESFGSAPRVFKAGRYGLGAATVEILDAIGFEVDNSVCPTMDFSVERGPDYTGFTSRPFFLTPRLLEIPCTVDFVGWLGPLRPVAHRLASTTTLERLRATGILARLGATNKVMLSPEGNSLAELCWLAESLVRSGHRSLTLTFHSPSVAPGHTPYVTTQADVDRFLADLDRFCEFFVTKLEGVPDTPGEFRTSLMKGSSVQ